jgi:eukaryotic-like serine/threonine-protein kinase
VPDPSPDVFRPGALFHERYRVVRCIKAGGMGAVYEVIDERTSSRRALKVMLPNILGDEAMRARFAQEARVTGAIESDHVVQVSDAGVDAPTGMPFLVMELLRGDELGAMLEARGALSPDEVRLYLAQAARALDRTHQAGIIHRDLKPENLFIARRDDGSPCLKVLDFGIAKVRSAAAVAAPSRPVGTPLYMAPEQLSGGRGAGPRADLYALAHIAYTLLVGEAYWHTDLRGAGGASSGIGRFFAKVREGVKEPPSARAARRGVTLGAAFDGWFLKATALAPEDRFESAEALVDALASALPGASLGLPEAVLLARSSPERLMQTTLVEADGERVGPFQLVHDLGHEGAVGSAPVWLAHEVYDGTRLRDVALMLFCLPEGVSPGSPEAARIHAAILDEARALCRVEHHGVARFYALHHEKARGVVALAMEHVPGPSLAARLAEAGPLTEAEVIEAGIAIAWALAAVHATGIVHRDVRPANVIRGASGYKLVHFGIAMGAVGSAKTARRRGATLAGAATTALPTGEQVGGTMALPTGEQVGGTMALPTDEQVGGTMALPTGEPSGGTGEPAFGTRVLPEVEAERDVPAARATPHAPKAAEIRPAFVGAPFYLAPECALGAVPSPAADLHALGVTLFELATGALPHGEPLPSVTPAGKALAALIDMLLQEDPSSRPRHADWVARGLEQARALLPHLEGDAGEAEPSSPARDGGATRGGSRALDEAPPALRLPPPLVGRGTALAALGRAAAEARDGAVRFALITGPMGVGRTRLLEAAVASAGIPRGRVLMMRGSPERRGALRPLLRALDEHARAFGEAALRPLAEAARAAFADAPRGAREACRDPVEAVEDALVWASVEAPLLLAMDDLQWADAQTLDLLRLLAGRAAEPSTSRLLVLAAARNEPNPEPKLLALLALLARLSRLAGVERQARYGVMHIALGPLAAADAAALAEAVAPLSPELEQAVVRASGGVPFFIVHALSALHETGAIVLRDGALHANDPRALSGEVPGVAELVEARIASVFEPGSAAERVAHRALAAVALYGGGLGIEIVMRVAGGAPEDAESALEALTSAGIVIASGERQEYGFAQEMVRQAVLNLVRPRAWFYRLHRALLDALAERASGLEEAAFLADGYEKLGALLAARGWLARAMQAASASGLFIEARELGDRLAARVTEPEAREALSLDVIRALLRGRSFEEAKLRLARGAALDRGRKLTAAQLRRRIYRLEAAYGLREPGASDPALVADADALGDLALRCEARMALACVSPDEEAMRWLGEAVSLSASIGPEMEHAARALRIERNHAGRRFDVALAEADLRRALVIAEATSAVWQSVILEGDLAIIEAESGRLDAAIERTARLRERTVAIGMRWQTPVFAQNLSALLLRAGRNREAAEAAARTAELAVAAGDSFLRATALSLRADALRRAGCLTEALASVDEAEALQRERGGRSRALTLLRRAMIRDALGMHEAALEDVRAAREAGERHGDPNVALGAEVWETLRRAQGGEVARGEVERLVARTTEARIGLLAREIVAEARSWLESSVAPGMGSKAQGRGEA